MECKRHVRHVVCLADLKSANNKKKKSQLAFQAPPKPSPAPSCNFIRQRDNVVGSNRLISTFSSFFVTKMDGKTNPDENSLKTPAMGNQDDLSDLIPPDIVELDEQADWLESDSVSYSSSGSGGSDCVIIGSDDEFQEINIPRVIIKLPKPPDERPGIRIDPKEFAPMSLDAVKKLPKAKIYSCPKPNCTFTTTSATVSNKHKCSMTQN